ncbi:MAG: thiamine biosynthesis protein ApbE [Bacteroidetes bacterium GWF2_38_335]|nr:MAG: thiamine biosynthesis protein ApbE [Bacteroidetes bacterium GWF2_38_335]OFY79936.1 MAG: thiamine biosynthesis protein ApbE [Bacteroidetes bacterium RIFOXYA12_FULL_38_20]
MPQKSKIFKSNTRLMGNRFEFTVVGENESYAQTMTSLAIEEISRIERLLTTFDENSQTNLINRNAGIEPVPVEKEVFDLISRSIKISELTQGAFDISYGGIDKKFWNFDTTMKSLPDKSLAKNAVRLINYRNIITDKTNLTVFLKEKGMRIGFGGIGKGYAADMAKKVLMENGVESGIINASGDLTAWGKQPDGKPWTVGIANPNSSEKMFSSFEISDKAIATSGNYEKFAMIDGKRYSHTIDPKTGFPVSGIKSVTVIAPYAEVADALATPVMVMGTSVGMNLINQVKGISCIIVDDYDKIFTSDNISIS